MKYNPELHHRRSIRLKEYDYTRPGAYFITICTWKWECLFGEIKNAEMNLNEYGCIVKNCWNELPHHYSHIGLDMYVIMPNHMHGIIKIIDAGTNTGANTNVGTNANVNVNANVGANVRAGFKPAPTMQRHGLPEIVRALKTFSSRKINGIRNTANVPVWQRNYYEHIIRNEKELNSICEYIINNPLRWDLGEDNPMNIN